MKKLKAVWDGAKEMAKGLLAQARGLVHGVGGWLNGARKFVADQGRKVVRKAEQWAGEVRDFTRRHAQQVETVVVTVVVLAVESTAHAQSTTPDASTIVSTAQTTFNAVGALVAAAVGFFIIVKIVKWIRK